MIRRSILLGLLGVLVTGTGVIHARISQQSIAERDADAFVPRPEFAKIAALGFDTVMADFYWLQAVQVVGSANANPVQYGTHLGRLIDVVTTLDPWVDHAYRFAAIWLTGSEEDVRSANRLLERSFDYHPWEWRNRFYLGYNLFFYLGENEQAANVLEAASRLDYSPRYLARLVARLRSEHADIETAEVFLRQLLTDAPDPMSANEYRSALDEIEIERRARHLDRARESYRKLNGFDVDSVWDLVRAEGAVLEKIPPPWPASLPKSLVSEDYRWEFDSESDRFVSSYYGHRYELTFHPRERDRVDQWKRTSDDERAPSDASADDSGDRG
jgi:tetratricopeptide (TPR) repeat protein